LEKNTPESAANVEDPAGLKKSGRPQRKIILFAVKAVLSIGIVSFLLHKIELTKVIDSLAKLDNRYFILTVSILVFHMIVLGLRWHIILRALGAHISYIQSVKYFAISLFFNQLLPGGLLAPAARIWWVYNRGVSPRIAYNSVLLERFVQIIGLIILVIATHSLLLERMTESLPSNSFLILVLTPILAILFLIFFKFIPSKYISNKILKFVAEFAADFWIIFCKLKSFLVQVSFSLLAHCITILAAYTLSQGFGLEIRIIDVFALMPIVIAITLLPISVNGWGVREIAMIGVFSMIGIQESDILALSITLGACILISRLTGGILWLWQRKIL
jgi:glycosyltransferase 2 family protein